MAVKNKEKIYKLTLTAVLTALIFVMAFTPLGYLKIGTVSITFLMIPVVIGAIVGGPSVGTVLGLMFGATSFIDTFGTTLFGINPVYTAIMCFVPRILMGLFCGLIYKAFGKKNYIKTGTALTSFCGGFINTVLFVGALLLLFYNSDYIQSFGNSVIAVISVLITFNAVIEWIACTVIGSAVSIALNKALKKRF